MKIMVSNILLCFLGNNNVNFYSYSLENPQNMWSAHVKTYISSMQNLRFRGVNMFLKVTLAINNEIGILPNFSYQKTISSLFWIEEKLS